MRNRHYADDAQPSLRMEFHWDERSKGWILTTTRPGPGSRGKVEVEYYKIDTAAAIDRGTTECLAFVVMREMQSWLF